MLGLLRTLGGRRPKGRALLSVVGIALGVALGYGVYLVNRAAVEDLASAVRKLAGDADLQVRGGRGGFPESLYPRIARLPGVAAASAGLELDAGLAGTERTVRIIGIDAVRAGRIELLKPDRVILSPASAALVKNRLELVIGEKTVSLIVAGVDASLNGVVALTDVATAQWRLERMGELNRLDVFLRKSVDRERIQQQIANLLPPGVQVQPVESAEQASAYPSRAYRVNLDVLAMVALFTGGFLVFSAQTLEVARRRGEHALLRVLGLRRGGLARLVLAEAACLGVLGGALGVALGYALAAAALRAWGADLGAGAFRGVFPRLGFAPLPALLFFLSGVGVAVSGALVPALDAARAAPARALKAGDEQALLGRLLPAWPGVALVLAGAMLAQLGPVNGLPLFGYAAIACLLVGAVFLVPKVFEVLMGKIPRSKNPALALAMGQLRGAPGQAAVSLAAIVASFALMAAMAIMVASFRDSLGRWLDAVLPADLYFRTTHAGDTGYLEPEFAARVRALPQVARGDFLRSGRLLLDSGRPPVVLLARDRAAPAFPVGRQYERRAGDPPPAWVSEAVFDLYGFAPGATIKLPLANQLHDFVVIGVFRDYARQHGAIQIDRADYAALTGDRRINDGALWLAPGATPAQAMEAIRALPGAGGVDLALPGDIREVSLRIFDRSFAATYAMEAVAVLVGLFGLSSSLGAIVLARRREFGVLRHLGVTRRQIGAMLAAEGGLLALVGAAAGLAAGWAIALVLVHVVNRQSFNWSMEIHAPYALLAGLATILVGLSVLTAVLSGREAMSAGAVRSVREDW
ncbi:MAG TPA: FtsX-like permease family protein [Burkholderiales bacterium]